MKFLIIIGYLIAYIAGGIYLETSELIVEPAYFSLYGAAMLGGFLTLTNWKWLYK